MRFIKRLIFVIILLVVAFFIYRLINPTAAKELLYDLKTFSNDKIGTNFSLTTKALIVSWTTSTDTIIELTWNLSGISDEELLLNDMDFIATGNWKVSLSWATSTWTTTKTPSSKVVVTTSATPPLPEAPVVVPKTTVVPKKITPCPAMPTVNSCPTGQEKYISYSSSACGTYYACRTKTVTTSSPKGLSSQDVRDFKALFWN